MAIGNCFRCRSPATEKCSGCSAAPAYDNSLPVLTFYCSSGCQKLDWRRHRTECRKLQARKSLNRAALLLQAVIYNIRLHATTLNITSVRVEGTTVYLTGPLPNPLCTQQLRPFPAHLFEDQAILESVLVYTACMEAMVFLCNFITELLQDICSEIKEVTVSVIKHRLRICHGPTHRPHTNTPQSIHHNVYRVELKQGEVWVIDPTGAQFGYYEPLCSWGSFQQRISKVDRVNELGYIRHKVFYNHIRYPIKSMVSQQAEKEVLVKAVEYWLFMWVTPHSGKFNAMLQGSEAIFDGEKHMFLERLSAHIKESLARMYVPAELAKRTKEVEAQVARNRGDSTSVNEFEGLLKFFVSATGDPYV